MFRALSPVLLWFWLISPSLGGDYTLDATERDVVRRLAEKVLKDQSLSTGRVVLTRIEVFQDSRSPSSAKKVVAIFYRYEGDLAILVSINITRREVLRVESYPHMPTSLTPDELAEAEKLAREHPDVVRSLAKQRPEDKIEVDSLVPRTVDPESPYYHHRVVRIHFRIGRTYLLYGPTVDVDLHTRKVYVQGVSPGHP